MPPEEHIPGPDPKARQASPVMQSAAVRHGAPFIPLVHEPENAPLARRHFPLAHCSLRLQVDPLCPSEHEREPSAFATHATDPQSVSLKQWAPDRPVSQWPSVWPGGTTHRGKPATLHSRLARQGPG